MTTLPVLAVGLVCREALDDPISGQHASIDGKVPADHERSHGRVLLGKDIRFVGEIGLILAAIHKDEAGIATGVAVALVHRIPPPTAPAEAW